MIADIFNRDSLMCVKNLQEFLTLWKESYTEDHPLNEQFKKIISKILRKSVGKIDSSDYAGWFNGLFADNVANGNYMGADGVMGEEEVSGDYGKDEAVPVDGQE